MKKILIYLLFILGFILSNETNAQQYSSNHYYTQQYYIQDVCNGCLCQRANWYSAQGWHDVWLWNSWTGQWYVEYQYGWYYWYTWINYRHPSCY